jgi:hypothetical protein
MRRRVPNKRVMPRALRGVAHLGSRQQRSLYSANWHDGELDPPITGRAVPSLPTVQFLQREISPATARERGK